MCTAGRQQTVKQECLAHAIALQKVFWACAPEEGPGERARGLQHEGSDHHDGPHYKLQEVEAQAELNEKEGSRDS